MQSEIGRFTTYNYCKDCADNTFPQYMDVRPPTYEVLTKQEFEDLEHDKKVEENQEKDMAKKQTRKRYEEDERLKS